MNEAQEPQVLGIYWAPASKYQLANWKKETRGANGQILTPEQPLQFFENIFVAKTKKEVDFIEKSDAFEKGQIVKCEDMAAARVRSLGRKASKTATELTSTIDETMTLRK